MFCTYAIALLLVVLLYDYAFYYCIVLWHMHCISMLICDPFHICDDLRKMNKSINESTLLMAHSKAKFKSNGNNTSPCFKPFLQETCRHIFVYLNSAIGFIWTLLLALPLHRDIKLNDNIIQDLPPNWIIGFLEFCSLSHCIPPPKVSEKSKMYDQ